jgi:hypothetical protein
MGRAAESERPAFRPALLLCGEETIEAKRNLEL